MGNERERDGGVENEKERDGEWRTRERDGE